MQLRDCPNAAHTPKMDSGTLREEQHSAVLETKREQHSATFEIPPPTLIPNREISDFSGPPMQAHANKALCLPPSSSLPTPSTGRVFASDEYSQGLHDACIFQKLFFSFRLYKVCDLEPVFQALCILSRGGHYQYFSKG